MICDSIEAASRSLEEINEQTLTELVNRLVSEKAEDGQFDECQLTFEELGKVKRTLVKTLLLAHHVRVKYPKKEKRCLRRPPLQRAVFGASRPNSAKSEA